MPEMWQCAADSDREVWGESGAAVLGVFGVSEVSDGAESMRSRSVEEIVAVPPVVHFASGV